MRAGLKFEFLWCDDVKYKRPGKQSIILTTNLLKLGKMNASEYIKRSIEQCQSLMDDESIFPTSEGVEFVLHSKGKYQAAIKTIFKRIFRIYAHMYHHHYQSFIESKVDALLNTSFKHFIYFVQEFQLITEKDLEPLEQIIKNC